MAICLTIIQSLHCSTNANIDVVAFNEISRGCKTQNNTILHYDHVDNKRLSKEINPLPLYLELYIYLKKISKITQVLSDSFVGCPSSGVNKYRLTKKQRNAVLNSQQKWKFWARILKERPNKVFFYNPVVNDIVHRLDVVCQRLSNYPPDLAMFSILLSFSYSPLLRQVRHTCQSRKFF